MKNHGGLSVHESTERWEMKLKLFMEWVTCGSYSLVRSYSMEILFEFEQRNSFDLEK